ncbi:MAG: class I SAM-dependent methyltransferase [Polyangiaceae bacterium]|nr:class I SAM-dependent methyltransferase [Polyangiaceae bacterium]
MPTTTPSPPGHPARDTHAAPLRVVSELRADTAAFDVSHERELIALWEAEDRHFWHRTRNQLVERRLARLGVVAPARVLDLGCGSGCVAAHLARRGLTVTGVDGHRPLLEVARRRAPSATFLAHDLSRGVGALGLGEFAAVGLFDVLEHLDDPRAALEGALGCAAGGGLVVGTVPASMALWSRVDERAGHRLRYEARELRRLLASVPGAVVLEVESLSRVLFPMFWAQRRWVAREAAPAISESNLAVPPAPVNRALGALVLAEERLGRAARFLPSPGTSLWFAIRRRTSRVA